MSGSSVTEKLKSVALAALFVLLVPSLVFLYLCCWQTETTVLLVRSAAGADGAPPAGECPPPGMEHSVTESVGPGLTDAGKERAFALAHAASEVGVAAVYVNEYCRSQWTVKPLLDRAGLTTAQFAASDVRGLIRHIHEHHRGKTVLVAGQSERIPQILTGLGSRTVPPQTDADFDDLFVITVYRFGEPRVLRIRYGREM